MNKIGLDSVLPDATYSMREVAQILGIHIKTVPSRLSNAGIKTFKIGGRRPSLVWGHQIHSMFGYTPTAKPSKGDRLNRSRRTINN